MSLLLCVTPAKMSLIIEVWSWIRVFIWVASQISLTENASQEGLQV